MKSLLNYIGKKSYLHISKYIESSNLDIDTYCEPFSGGFSAGLNLMESGFTGKVILNDLDEEVYNFWVCLKENWELLYNKVIAITEELETANIKDEQMQVLYKYKTSTDKFDRAVAEYTYRKMLTMTGIRMSVKKFNDLDIEFFLQSKMLNDGNVEIYNLDYKEILSRFDGEKTFFLIDPPYYIDNVSSYYRCDSSFFYHKELRDIVLKLKAKVLVTYNDNNYIKSLYEDGMYIEYIERCFGNYYYEIYFNNFKEFEKPVPIERCKELNLEILRELTIEDINLDDYKEAEYKPKSQEDMFNMSELFS